MASDMEFFPLWLRVDASRATPLADPLEFVEKADAFFLRDESLIGDPTLSDHLAAQILSGKRLLAELNPGTQDRLDALNRFLSRYDIKGTMTGIFRRDEAAADVPGWFFPEHEQPDLFELIRDAYPQSFRDSFVFSNVDRVRIRSPRLIEYGRKANPTLIIPETSSGLIDKTTDLPSDWTARELACVVEYHEEYSHGAVLAFSGHIFTDSILDTNQRLSANLLKWLKGVQASEPQPFALVSQIEKSLLEVLTKVLGKDVDSWWRRAVPEPIRIECSKRCEQADIPLPKHAYLDLIDYKKIMESNWTQFQPPLSAVGWQGGKQKSLSWFDRLNEIRKTTAHPTRAMFSAPLTSDDLNFLQDCLSRTLRMLSR